MKVSNAVRERPALYSRHKHTIWGCLLKGDIHCVTGHVTYATESSPSRAWFSLASFYTDAKVSHHLTGILRHRKGSVNATLNRDALKTHYISIYHNILDHYF